jgi:hypothetical protein
MKGKGRNLSLTKGRKDAVPLIQALHFFADNDMKTSHWENTKLWIRGMTLKELAELTSQYDCKLKSEDIRNAIHCLERLNFLSDERGSTNSKTKTGSRLWTFYLDLPSQDMPENLNRLFGKNGQEGEWDRRLAQKKVSEIPELKNGLGTEALVEKVRQQVQPDINRRCGSMRVLDMEQPITLDSIYTRVNILSA